MKCTTLLASIGAIVLCAGVAAFAPPGEDVFEITRYSIDGGGGTSSDGVFAVSGTIGQFDAGPGSTGMSGGDFVLSGGFHSIGEGNVPICPEDFNSDGQVGFSDLLVVLTAWGACDACPADLDGDGFVAFGDLLAMLVAWGPCQ